ncbi:MAG: hypothetical protein V1778_02285 [bacterium]
MEASRPYFWQLATLSALLPFVGFWPALVLSGTAGPASAASASENVAEEKPPQYFPLPQVAEYGIKRTIRLTVTAYSSTPDQTDASPLITASGTLVRDGILAHNFLPFGTRIRFPEMFGDKVFVVEDRMRADKGQYLADMWMPTREQAQLWGARVLTMEVLDR